jgi:hypothetical protein
VMQELLLLLHVLQLRQGCVCQPETPPGCPA